MPLSRPAPKPFVSLAAGLLCAAVLTGCGEDEPAETLGGATDDLVQASRERFEASEEFREASAEAEKAAAEAQAKPAKAAQKMEAANEESLATADQNLDAAKAALGRQADDLFGEVEAAIAERRYPQAHAALETLKKMPGAEPELTERISAAEEALGLAERNDEALGSARAAIDAARSRTADTTPPPGGAGPEIGSPPADGEAMEK